MKICIIGSGYVGLATSVSLADMGHSVVCVDIDKAKVDKLKNGICPFYDPGLQEFLRKSTHLNLEYTSDGDSGLRGAEVVFVAVGTPPKQDGSADLSQVYAAIRLAVTHATTAQVLVLKSTVPVGTSDAIQKEFPNLNIVYNPEFLREGYALFDAQNPQRIILGSVNTVALDLIRNLYSPLAHKGVPILTMDAASAEMTKYVSNVMLATRVSLMNEISRICEKTGADIEQVRIGVGSDKRIGSEFLCAGIGFGGSCLPKDLSALISLGENFGEKVSILKAVREVNSEQKRRFADKIFDRLRSPKATIAVWGVTFKPNSDDLRDSPALEIIEVLLAEGHFLKIYDPTLKATMLLSSEHQSRIQIEEDPLKATVGADLLCIFTEWDMFRKIDPFDIKKTMKSAVVFDGRNIFDSHSMNRAAVEYHSIGRL